MIINQSSSASSIYYDPWHPPRSICVFDSLFSQPLSKYSLVYLWVWNHPLHTPCISSPNHYLLFATHAHTIAACFALVLRLCHLFLVSLSSLYLELSFTLTWHTHPSNTSQIGGKIKLNCLVRPKLIQLCFNCINRACIYNRIWQVIPNIYNACREKMFS